MNEMKKLGIDKWLFFPTDRIHLFLKLKLSQEVFFVFTKR